MKKKKKEQLKLFPLFLVQRILLTLLVVFSFEIISFPVPVFGSLLDEARPITEEEQIVLNDSSFDLLIPDNPYLEVSEDVVGEFPNHLPNISKKSVTKSDKYYALTAYNSEVSQTDSDPCTTANGFNLCRHGKEDTVAANFLPFNTKIKIPALFGDKVFIVRDRMNSRYRNRIDIWMINRSDALKFGRRAAKIEIIKDI